MNNFKALLLVCKMHISLWIVSNKNQQTWENLKISQDNNFKINATAPNKIDVQNKKAPSLRSQIAKNNPLRPPAKKAPEKK